ncbi:hypothetical protein ACFLQ2_00905 [archaeon]
MKLLQGGVIAVVMLMVVYGVVQSVREQAPAASVFFVTSELLSSAYAGRETGVNFVREAILEEEEFSSEALVFKSGLPSNVDVFMHCRHPYCLEGEVPVTVLGKCGLVTSRCTTMGFAPGESIDVCVVCEENKCHAWFGETVC